MTVREPKKRSNLRLKLGGAYFSAQRKLRWLSMRKHFCLLYTSDAADE